MALVVVKDHRYLGMSGTAYPSRINAIQVYRRKLHSRMWLLCVESLLFIGVTSLLYSMFNEFPGAAEGQSRYFLALGLSLALVMYLIITWYRFPTWQILFWYLLNEYDIERQVAISIECGDLRVEANQDSNN